MSTVKPFRRHKDYDLPLLELLKKLGGSGYRDMIYREFESDYGESIPAKHYEKRNGKEPAWMHVVWWACYRLKQKGLCTRRHAFWGLTKEGEDWLNNNRAVPDDIKARKLEGLGKQVRTKRRTRRSYETARFGRDTLLEIKQYLPAEVFNRIFGTDWLKTQFDYITGVLSGNTIHPSDFELCELVRYCYQNGLYEEAINLYCITDCRAAGLVDRDDAHCGSMPAQYRLTLRRFCIA